MFELCEEICTCSSPNPWGFLSIEPDEGVFCYISKMSLSGGGCLLESLPRELRMETFSATPDLQVRQDSEKLGNSLARDIRETEGKK